MTREQDICSSDNSALVAQTSLIRTLRLKVRPSVKSWLDAAAVEVNQCWNWANATSGKAARPFVGPGQWLSSYDLNRLSSGATEYFEHIGADTIQRVNAEFVTRRRQFHKVKLRWRASRGPKRALLKEVKRWRDGCFAQDAVGDWWLCLPVECGGVVHDRDVNAARNILKVGVRSRAYQGSPPSVSGNESRRSKSPPSQTSRRCEARTATKTAAA
jgi:hypothetical protein